MKIAYQGIIILKVVQKMKIILRSGREVEISTKSDLLRYLYKCKTPMRDIVNAVSEGIISCDEYHNLMIDYLH